LEIYDLVLPSRSMPTLVGLLPLYTPQGILDVIRGRAVRRMKCRAGDLPHHFEASASGRIPK
jgi:ABC-type protease/lipase transport system fused ATPase/permease subunit